MKLNRNNRTDADAKNSVIMQNDGFTILEVVMASAIFAIGILGVCALQTAALKTISSANYITAGTTNAQDKLEELLELPFSDSDLSVGDHTESSPPSGYTITWTVAANTSSSKSVAVTSSWQNVNGMSVNSQLNFIKYDW
jgi:type IV pilus assembly protein PilV